MIRISSTLENINSGDYDCNNEIHKIGANLSKWDIYWSLFGVRNNEEIDI
jgi:hypothetical protein